MLYSEVDKRNSKGVEEWLLKFSSLSLESSEHCINEARKFILDNDETRKVLANSLISKHREDPEKDVEDRAQNPQQWLTSRLCEAYDLEDYEAIEGWFALLAPVMAESSNPNEKLTSLGKRRNA